MTTNKSIEEIMEEFMNIYTERDDFNGKAAGAKYNRIMYARHWQPTDKLIDWLRTTLQSYAQQQVQEGGSGGGGGMMSTARCRCRSN